MAQLNDARGQQGLAVGPTEHVVVGGEVEEIGRLDQVLGRPAQPFREGLVDKGKGAVGAGDKDTDRDQIQHRP